MSTQKVAETQIKGETIPEIPLWKQVWGTTQRGVVGSAAVLMFGGAILLASLVAAADPVRVKPFEGTPMVTKKVLPSVKPTMGWVAQPEASASGKVEYYLPYPGMLPDSPLYRIKALRDRLRLWTIFDEEGKAKQELFYADKRISAAMVLVDGGKADLGVSTASKAEKYLEQAVQRTVKLSKEGKDMKSLLLGLTKATAKHVELLDGLQGKVQGTTKDMVTEMKTKTEALQAASETALKESK